jgi:hypothetical protein
MRWRTRPDKKSKQIYEEALKYQLQK